MGNIMMTILGVVEVMAMMAGLFCTPFTKEKKRILAGTLLLIVLCVLKKIGGDTLPMFTVEIFLQIIIFLIWMDGGLIRKVGVYFCSMVYTGLPYFCMNLICFWVFDKEIIILEESIVYQIARALVTILFVVVLSIIVRKTEYMEIIRALPTGYFVVGSICAMAGAFIQSFVQDAMNIYGKTVFTNIVVGALAVVIVSFYLLGVGVVIMSWLKKRYQIESSLKDEYLRTTREYVKMVRQNARETRKIRHDMQSHISMLDYYLEQNQYQKAKEYLGQLKTHMEQSIRKVASVNHEIVDAILAEMQYQSEGDAIKWEVEGMLSPELKIPDFDLCTIFSNILRNSVEACKKLSEEERYIQLGIRQLDSSVLIEVKNPVNNPVEIEKLGTITSKLNKENHGFGIANVMDMVTRNHGELSFENQKGVFVTRIIFYEVNN